MGEVGEWDFWVMWIEDLILRGFGEWRDESYEKMTVRRCDENSLIVKVIIMMIVKSYCV